MVWQVHRVHWKGQHSRTTTTSTGAVALILTTKKSSGNWSQVPLAKILGWGRIQNATRRRGLFKRQNATRK